MNCPGFKAMANLKLCEITFAVKLCWTKSNECQIKVFLFDEKNPLKKLYGFYKESSLYIHYFLFAFLASPQNSIRHNLSLHSRFMRVQNEGTGKSSWWMLNPDAKPGNYWKSSGKLMKIFNKLGRLLDLQSLYHLQGNFDNTGSIIDRTVYWNQSTSFNMSAPFILIFINSDYASSAWDVTLNILVRVFISNNLGGLWGRRLFEHFDNYT